MVSTVYPMRFYSTQHSFYSLHSTVEAKAEKLSNRSFSLSGSTCILHEMVFIGQPLVNCRISKYIKIIFYAKRLDNYINMCYNSRVKNKIAQKERKDKIKFLTSFLSKHTYSIAYIKDFVKYKWGVAP